MIASFTNRSFSSHQLPRPSTHTPANKEEILKFIKQCQHKSGGISASVGHDPHLLYTLSAVQILVLLDSLNENVIDLNKVVEFVQGLQQSDGSFFGDKWGEVDVRFSFCAIATLKILKRESEINLEKAIGFVMKCHNFIDGGFGSKPGSESHAGLIYCSLGCLALTNNLHLVDADLLGWWLCERQLNSGGLNGRPEKLPDLCYSWWVLSSLTILGRLHWINRTKLFNYILACQDDETGGFNDRPGNLVDPFHTVFGLAGVSLLSHEYNVNLGEEGECISQIDIENYKSKIKLVNPVLCLPQEIVDKLDIEMQVLSL